MIHALYAKLIVANENGINNWKLEPLEANTSYEKCANTVTAPMNASLIMDSFVTCNRMAKYTMKTLDSAMNKIEWSGLPLTLRPIALKI